MADRKQRSFCGYCKAIRNAKQGASQCERSDCAGVKLLAKIQLDSGEQEVATATESQTSGVTCYYCHAGMLEMLTPIRLFLGTYGASEAITLGAVWGGQVRTADMQPDFDSLSERTGVPPLELATYYGNIESISWKALDVHEQNLMQTAHALSEMVTELYHRREGERADRMVSVFGEALDRVLQRKPTDTFALRQSLGSALHTLARDYDLGCSVIYSVRRDRDRDRIEAFRIAGWPDPAEKFARVKSTRFSPDTEAVADWNAQPFVMAGTDDPLVKKILVAGGVDPNTAAVTVTPFTTGRAGRYLWVTAERGNRRWQIRQDGLQNEFAHIFSDVSSRIISHFDTTALLGERERTVEKLQETAAQLKKREQRTRDLIIRVSHLVSRPILQLRLARDNPLEFDAGFFELERASKTFQTFARLSVAGKGGSEEPSRAPIDVLPLISEVQKTLAPFARLKRQTLKVFAGDEHSAREGISFRSEDELREVEDRLFGMSRIHASRESIVEVLENLVHNSVKYSIGGREVELQLRAVDEGVEILVVNYGCGIEASEHQKIFDLEYRSEMARMVEAEGAGIGLWVVRELVKKEKGEVYLAACTKEGQVEDKFGDKIDRHKVVFRLWLPFG